MTAAAGRDLRIIWWVWPAFYTAFGVIFVLLGKVMPPPRPDISDATAAAFFRTNGTLIQIGFVLLMFFIGGAAVTNGLVLHQMKQMSTGSVFAYAYAGAMAVGALPGCLLVATCFITAAFRPDRSPATQHLLYDLGMLSFNGSLGCFTAAYFAFAVAILLDRNRIFPVWFAYVNIWQIVTEVIATMMFVSPSGPFAWNGAIAFWWAVGIFVVWLVCLMQLLKKRTGA